MFRLTPDRIRQLPIDALSVLLENMTAQEVAQLLSTSKEIQKNVQALLAQYEKPKAATSENSNGGQEEKKEEERSNINVTDLVNGVCVHISGKKMAEQLASIEFKNNPAIKTVLASPDCRIALAKGLLSVNDLKACVSAREINYPLEILELLMSPETRAFIEQKLLTFPEVFKLSPEILDALFENDFKGMEAFQNGALSIAKIIQIERIRDQKSSAQNSYSPFALDNIIPLLISDECQTVLLDGRLTVEEIGGANSEEHIQELIILATQKPNPQARFQLSD